MLAMRFLRLNIIFLQEFLVSERLFHFIASHLLRIGKFMRLQSEHVNGCTFCKTSVAVGNVYIPFETTFSKYLVAFDLQVNISS